MSTRLDSCCIRFQYIRAATSSTSQRGMWIAVLVAAVAPAQQTLWESAPSTTDQCAHGFDESGQLLLSSTGTTISLHAHNNGTFVTTNTGLVPQMIQDANLSSVSASIENAAMSGDGLTVLVTLLINTSATEYRTASFVYQRSNSSSTTFSKTNYLSNQLEVYANRTVGPHQREWNPTSQNQPSRWAG